MKLLTIVPTYNEIDNIERIIKAVFNLYPAGLALNLFVMKTVLVFRNPPYKVIAQAAGILAGMAVNFVFSKVFVFGGKK